MFCLPHDVSEEFEDVASVGNFDGPEDTDSAEVVGRVPVSSIDSPQADAMGDVRVAIFDTVSFSGASDDELFHSTSAEMDSEALSSLFASSSRVTS